MIARRHIVGLGVSQIICWGVSFYLIGVFGDHIGADMGWSRQILHGGFSVALLTMGLISPFVGRLIDEIGGRPVLAFGSVLLAVGCLMLSQVVTVTGYYVAWIVTGVAMRCTLYDAAFAALARIAGPDARKPISQITLLGGLAATFFWPIGHLFIEAFGWREALIVYAVLALSTLAVHLPLPTERFHHAHEADDQISKPDKGRDVWLRAWLFATIVTLGNAFHTGMSAHLIQIFAEFGLGAGLAVTVSSVRGIGQSLGRLADVLCGSRLHPVDLNLLAAAILPLSFAVGLASGVSIVAAFGFSFWYGVGTGLLTITRGALPLVLFDTRTYGAFVGKLLVPSFLASAASPFLFAIVIEEYGGKASLVVSIAILLVILAASLGLKAMQTRK